MELALLGFAAALPLTAGVWRWFSIRKMQLVIIADTEKRKEQQQVEARRWQDAIDATAARLGGLEATVGAVLAELATIKARHDAGREVVNMKRGA